MAAICDAKALPGFYSEFTARTLYPNRRIICPPRAINRHLFPPVATHLRRAAWGEQNMTIELLVEPLRRVALFQGLQPAQLNEIARRSERIQFKAGDTVISEGQPADAAILIVTGTAKR